MKKSIFYFILPLGVVSVLLTSCSSGVEKMTDLSGIYIDDLSLGYSISEVDLSRYTKSDKYSWDYEYKFDEIVIGIDNHERINYLFARFDENKIDIVINGNTVTMIDDVEDILGNNYQDKNYDKEQHLNEYVFEDKDENIKVEFIYSSFDGSLLWIIVSR